MRIGLFPETVLRGLRGRFASPSQVAGRQTGETLIGHADFQLADNVIQKMHIGNFTMYLKSIVYQQQNVYIADNIFSQGYLSGNGMEFWTPEKSKKMTLDSFDNSTPSIFSCLVPYDSPRQEGDYFMNEYPNPLDVTGLYNTTNPALEHMSSNREIHYATAPFYAALHRFDNSTPADAMSFGSYNRFNTMCFQGHQAMFNPTSRTYDLVQQNRCELLQIALKIALCFLCHVLTRALCVRACTKKNLVVIGARGTSLIVSLLCHLMLFSCVALNCSY